MPALRLRSGQAPAGIQWSPSLETPLRPLFRQRANYAQSSLHLAGKGVAATGIGPDVLRRVAIHELSPIHGVIQAADFVFNHEQLAARFGVDDILKAVLMGIALLRNQVMALQERMRP